jgi:hypothetical protein
VPALDLLNSFLGPGEEEEEEERAALINCSRSFFTAAPPSPPPPFSSNLPQPTTKKNTHTGKDVEDHHFALKPLTDKERQRLKELGFNNPVGHHTKEGFIR